MNKLYGNIAVCVCQVFGVGVNAGSVKDVPKKDSVLIFPHIQSIKVTQTQVGFIQICHNMITLSLSLTHMQIFLFLDVALMRLFL